MHERSRLVLLVMAVLLQLHARVLAQGSFNGTFEDSMGNFDLSGWTWDCENPEPDLGFMSNCLLPQGLRLGTLRLDAGLMTAGSTA